MSTNNRYRATVSAAKFAGKYASKATVGLARWATTDHTGSAKLMASLPDMGFVNTLSIILVHIVAAILGAIGSGILVFLLIGYGLPALLLI